jgi:hypothetical protein
MITWASLGVAEFLIISWLGRLPTRAVFSLTCRLSHDFQAIDMRLTCCFFQQRSGLRKRSLILPKFHCFFRATNAPMEIFGAYDELRLGNEFAVSAGPPAELFKGRHQ